MSQLNSLHNIAMRKILGTFRTTPVVAMEILSALPPVEVRLRHLTRRNATRILTMSELHPVRQRCPDTFPPLLDIPRESNAAKFTPWDSRNVQKSRYKSRLDKILSTLNEWVDPKMGIEQLDLDASAPWTEATTQTYITEGSKEDAAKLHKVTVKQLQQSRKALLCYSDGSMRDGNIGAGAVKIGRAHV